MHKKRKLYLQWQLLLKRRKLFLFSLSCLFLYMTVHILEENGYRNTQQSRNICQRILQDLINSSIDSVVADRTEKNNNACLNELYQHQNLFERQKNFVYRELQTILYCQIPKVGSTTIKKVLYYMNNSRYLGSPFQIPLIDVDSHMMHPKVKQITDLEKYDISVKFMFVRDPYYRLFSGYADKLFMTNSYYWKDLGRSIVERFRKNPSARSLACGHDVSFTEMVKYIISGTEAMDWHFEPMYKQCKPCSVKYNFIGKIETFNQDIKSLWKLVNKLAGLDVKFPDVEESAEKGEIREKIKWLFEGEKEITKCMTFFEAMKRVWRTLQIRGVIGRNVSMPFKESDAETMTMKQYENASYAAYEASGSKAYRKQCRNEALIEAYNSVSMEDLLALEEVFTPDCELFGYEKHPDYLFNKYSPITN